MKDIPIREWSESARKSIVYARDEVINYQHRYFKPEHLLLGLLKVGSFSALRLLREKRIDSMKLEEVLRKFLQKGKKIYAEPDIGMQIEIPLSKNAIRAISLATEEFEKMRDKQLEPKHILLGILKLNYQPIKIILKRVVKTKKK